jgi:bacterioferritin
MDTARVIDKLNEILRHEWTGVAQYAQAGFLVQGLWREVYSDKFFGDAKESFKHAQLVGEKITALGGVPTVERNAVQQSQDLMELLQNGLEFESRAVQLYTDFLPLIEDDRAFTVFIEDILKEEQEGVDEYTRILRGQTGGASAAPKAGKKTG